MKEGDNLNERVKELRKFLGFTMKKFGERVGVSESAISNIENGNRSVTPQMFKSICTTYGVSEEWLRTGEGAMLVHVTTDDEFAMIAGEIIKSGDSAFQTAIIEAWKRPELRKLVREYINVLQNSDNQK